MPSHMDSPVLLRLLTQLLVIKRKKNDLCNYTNAASNDGSFSLSSTHAAQARGHKDTATQVTGAQIPPSGIQYCQLSTEKTC